MSGPCRAAPASRLRQPSSRAALGLIAALVSTPGWAQQAATASSSTQPTPLTLQLQTDTADTERNLPALALPVTAVDTRPTAPDPALGTTVRLRSRPNYDASPIPVGAFDLRTAATVTGGYDSNVYRTRHGPGDAFGIAQFDLSLITDQPRNQLFFKAMVAEQAYRKYDSENALTYSVNAGGRLDIGHSDSLTLDVSQAHQVRERSAATEIIQTLRPIRYDLSTASLAGHKALGRIAIDTSLLFAYYNYHDARLPDGEPLDEDYRDNNSYTGRVDLSYALGPGPVVYVSAQGRLVRYLNGNYLGRDLDSDQIQLIAGIRGQISPLLRGQIGAGYIHANLRDGPNQSGPTVEASLQYLVTELTTVSLSADRTFENVGSVTTPLTLETQAVLQVDHELLRNLILTAAGTYRTNSYTTEDGGSHEWDGRLGAEWLLSHHLRATADLGYRDRSGFGRLVARDFHELTATVGLAYRP